MLLLHQTGCVSKCEPGLCSETSLPIVGTSKLPSHMSWFCALYFIRKACCLTKQVSYDTVCRKPVFDVSQQFPLCSRIKKNKMSEAF